MSNYSNKPPEKAPQNAPPPSPDQNPIPKPNVYDALDVEADTGTLTALIIDDDVWSLRILMAQLREVMPGIQITARTKPDPSGQFDLYFIDNDFGGIDLAIDLVKQIRTAHPTALIVALSATLDETQRRQLLDSQCNLVCNKAKPIDMKFALHAVVRLAHTHGLHIRRGK